MNITMNTKIDWTRAKGGNIQQSFGPTPKMFGPFEAEAWLNQVDV